MSRERKQHTSDPSPRRSGTSRRSGQHVGGSHADVSLGKESPLDKEAFTIPTNNGGIVLTRRNLLYGAVGVGVLAAASTGVKAISEKMSQREEIPVLKVLKESVTESTSLSEEPHANQLYLASETRLPYGTLIWANDDDYAALLLPTDMGSPLTQIGLLRLSSGYFFTILTHAVGLEEGFEIYDVRATNAGVIWTEVDILEGIWRIFTARLTDAATLSTPTLVDEGDSEWETPSIAICGEQAFWQVLPKAKGSKSTENSLLKSAKAGSSTVTVVLESRGRMSSPLYALDNAVVATPRADTDNVNYQLTLVDASSLEIKDTLVLPQSMRPLEAGYGNNGFTFSFEGIYNYGGGISNLGTYTPLKDGRNADCSQLPWFHFARTPSAPPCWCGDYFVVKSTKSVVCCNLEEKSYFYFDIPSGAQNYGDYLASTGSRRRIVTYTNVNDTPLNGSKETYCLARVWQSHE